MNIRLDDRQKIFLKLFLDYYFKSKKLGLSKLSRKRIKKELKLHDQQIKRLLDYFIGLNYIKKRDKEYSINPKNEEDIKDTLKYNEKLDKKLYDFIPLFYSLILLVILIGVIFYSMNYVYVIKASPNITSIIPKTSPFKTAITYTTTTNITCGKINESLGYNMICYDRECRCIEDINISEDSNVSGT